VYVIIGRHFVPLEGKLLLIELVIVKITLNVILRQMSAKQQCFFNLQNTKKNKNKKNKKQQ
jgi:hypothetical protein